MISGRDRMLVLGFVWLTQLSSDGVVIGWRGKWQRLCLTVISEFLGLSDDGGLQIEAHACNPRGKS